MRADIHELNAALSVQLEATVIEINEKTSTITNLLIISEKRNATLERVLAKNNTL